MKVQTTVTIDYNIAVKLNRMKNKSAFINSLLTEALKDLGDECKHQWRPAGTTAGGLIKECSLCGKTKLVNAS